MECTRYVYGIYYDGEIVYIGSTNNMTQRWWDYKSAHLNPKREHYNMKICKFMREKGFHNFSHQIIETFEDISKRDINLYEGAWQQTFEELGFNLLNKNKAGTGSGEKGTASYDKSQERANEKIPCELCGKLGARKHMYRHQQTEKCLNSRKVLFS